MSATDDHLGARIRAARGYAKLDQATLAKQIGLGREVVIAMEKDEREPTVPEVRRIGEETGAPTRLPTRTAGERQPHRPASRPEARVNSAEEDREDLSRERRSQDGF